MPTVRTSGNVSTRSRTLSTRLERLTASPVTNMRMVNTCSGWKPSFTSRRRENVRRSSPAPTRSTTASATSPTTSAARNRRWLRLSPGLRPCSFRAACSSKREVCQAGANPNTIAVRKESATVNARTRASNRTSANCPNVTASCARKTSARLAHEPRNRPSAPPIVDSATLSATSC